MKPILRERFERAFGTTSARSLARWNTGTYRDAAVELAWQMWQKGWRWSANACMEACEAEAKIESVARRCVDACHVVREAL